MTGLLKLEVNDIGGLGIGLIQAIRRMLKLNNLSMNRSRFNTSYLPELQSLPYLQTLSLKDSKTITDECIVALSCWYTHLYF